MNVNQIINMILRIVMRKGVNSAINAGVNQMGKRRAPPAGVNAPTDADRSEQTRIRAQRRARRAAR